MATIFKLYEAKTALSTENRPRAANSGRGYAGLVCAGTLWYNPGMERTVVGRFAPSPSGYLHMGNLLSSLLAWLDCRSLGGEMLFRMEDLDPDRSKSVYREAMAECGLEILPGYEQEVLAYLKRHAADENGNEAIKAVAI